MIHVASFYHFEKKKRRKTLSSCNHGTFSSYSLFCDLFD